MFLGNTYYGESGYCQLLEDTLTFGVDIPDRTGVGSKAVFDAKVIYREGEFPFSTVRPAPLRMAFEEFWFFLSGSTQTKALEDKGISFWKGNTSREFLDNRGLNDLEEGDMGQAYGYQLRGFNKGIVRSPSDVVDQLADTVKTLKKERYSRRVYTTLWNPSASKYMALTPCWHSHQFVCIPDAEGYDTLHLKLLNRSLDACFGFLFAVQQYRLYQMCIAKMFGMRLGALSADLTQVHIYANQVEYTKEILSRQAGKPGTVSITKPISSVDDILALQWCDIQVDGLEVNTTPFHTPKPPMAA